LLCVLENKNRKRKQETGLYISNYSLNFDSNINDEGKLFYFLFSAFYIESIMEEKYKTIDFSPFTYIKQKKKIHSEYYVFFYVFLHKTCYFSSSTSDSLIRKF
jgi:hypothetical protein